MKKHLFLWQLAGVVFTAALGTLLHFLFNWTQLPSFAPISAVNESTWEHMKLLFLPSFFFALIQFCFFRREFPNFWWVKLVGICFGTLLIPILFYTVNGAFGKTPDWLNIVFFFLAVIFSYLLELFLLQNDYLLFRVPLLAILTLFSIAFLFGVFTFYPAKLPLFQDPITSNYGIIYAAP